MINREEMLEFAREFQLEANVVEKDYALGWLLAGIGNHPVLRDAWVFKGGTCLKKCFFETYRFSEDLDFTVRDPAHLDVGFLSGIFAEIAEWVYDASGLEMPRETHKFEVFNNPRGNPDRFRCPILQAGLRYRHLASSNHGRQPPGPAAASA